MGTNEERIGESVAALHGAVEAVDESEWKAIQGETEIPAQARAESHYWCDNVFLSDANPHDVPGVRHALHRAREGTIDLMRHAYTAKGLALTVYEGRNFLLVRVDKKSLDLLAMPEAERPAAIAKAAEALFQAPLKFENCADVGEGATFCTDVGLDPRLCTSWAQRAESGVRGGALWFVAYKRVSQILGFFNPVQWFETPPRVTQTVALRTAARRAGKRSR